MASCPAGPLDHPSGVLSPRRESHGRPPAPVVLAPASVSSPVPTVPIPSNRDRAEPVGTPLLRLPPPTDVPPVTTTGLDALGTAAEFQFGDSAARYSHVHRAREQQIEPACNAPMRYIALGRPEALPADFFVAFPFPPAPSLFGGSGAS